MCTHAERQTELWLAVSHLNLKSDDYLNYFITKKIDSRHSVLSSMYTLFISKSKFSFHDIAPLPTQICQSYIYLVNCNINLGNRVWRMICGCWKSFNSIHFSKSDKITNIFEYIFLNRSWSGWRLFSNFSYILFKCMYNSVYVERGAA